MYRKSHDVNKTTQHLKLQCSALEPRTPPAERGSGWASICTDRSGEGRETSTSKRQTLAWLKGTKTDWKPRSGHSPSLQRLIWWVWVCQDSYIAPNNEWNKLMPHHVSLSCRRRPSPLKLRLVLFNYMILLHSRLLRLFNVTQLKNENHQLFSQSTNPHCLWTGSRWKWLSLKHGLREKKP